jgi:CRISP-associated protein Cas1
LAKQQFGTKSAAQPTEQSPMARKLLASIISDAHLRQAWRRVKANGGAPGQDRQSIADFETSLDASLLEIRTKVLDGTYRPRPMRLLPIPKPNGGERMLAIPSMADRILQASTAQVLDEFLDPTMSDASFGYRRGRSVEHAVARVTTYRLWGSAWVVDGDIHAYFDSIPHDALLASLSSNIRCDATLRLIALWLANFGTAGCGIAQGSPLSPLLANLYLDPVDKAIHTRRVRLVRFADDFVLVTRSQARAIWAKVEMARLLGPKGLRLNHEKTRVVSFAEGFEFLGYLFKDGYPLARS